MAEHLKAVLSGGLQTGGFFLALDIHQGGSVTKGIPVYFNNCQLNGSTLLVKFFVVNKVFYFT